MLKPSACIQGTKYTKGERGGCREEGSEALLSMLFGVRVCTESWSQTLNQHLVLLPFLLSDRVGRHGPESLRMWFSVLQLLRYMTWEQPEALIR